MSASPIRKREDRQVAGQPDPRRDDDIRLGAGAAQPFAGGRNQAIEIHPTLPSAESYRAGGRPVRSFPIRWPAAVVAASRAVPPPSLPAACAGAAPCPCAASRGESAVG